MHINPTNPQWDRMWDALRDACGSYTDECAESGEVWQYMGTHEGQHQFRHRHRPQFVGKKAIQPIKGFAGQHWDRVYLHIDAETFQVTKIKVKHYLPEKYMH